jgi:hypothetical protein
MPPFRPIPSPPAHPRDSETVSSTEPALSPAAPSLFPPASPSCVPPHSNPSRENKTGSPVPDSVPAAPAPLGARHLCFAASPTRTPASLHAPVPAHPQSPHPESETASTPSETHSPPAQTATSKNCPLAAIASILAKLAPGLPVPFLRHARDRGNTARPYSPAAPATCARCPQTHSRLRRARAPHQQGRPRRLVRCSRSPPSKSLPLLPAL